MNDYFDGKRLFPKTSRNSKIYLSESEDTLDLTDHTYGPIVVDKNGEEFSSQYIDGFIGWQIFGLTSEGALVIFYIRFLSEGITVIAGNIFFCGIGEQNEES